MLKLRHGDKILANVKEARTFFQRTRGLMFRSEWDENTTLWIHRCNSIHTGFVRFPIDVVFVDRNLSIKKIIKNIKPWKMTLPVLTASSVFEFISGTQKLNGLKVGDQLHVGD